MKKYMLFTSPTDLFYWTMSFEELKEKIEEEYKHWDMSDADIILKELKENMGIVEHIINKVSNEYPHTIRFFGIPHDYMCEIVIIAKASNNGNTFFFSDNLKFLKSIGDCGDIYQLYGEIKAVKL